VPYAMTPSVRKQTAFRIEPEILNGLQVVKERDGVPLAEQVRRALRAWLEEKGVSVTKAERKRAVTRRRS
jgi:predicted DNA-binding protein